MESNRRSMLVAARASSGFTLIEILVVIVVIGILVAFLLSAIQMARETSRRTQCANNLKQIGLALHSYESSNACFPQGINGTDCSVHTALLPHLEQSPLFDAINFNIDPSFATVAAVAENNTVLNTHLSGFLCPSDFHIAGGFGRTNYAGNGGVASFWKGCNGVFVDGGVRNRPYFGLAGIADGASQTAAMSEWVIGCAEEKNFRGIVFKTQQFTELVQFDAFISACERISFEEGFSLWGKFGHWMMGGYDETLMNHNVVINGKSCTNGGSINAGIWTAGSRHTGDGANTLFVDGHVQFVRDTIPLTTWRALSTRAGGEAIAAPE